MRRGVHFRETHQYVVFASRSNRTTRNARSISNQTKAPRMTSIADRLNSLVRVRKQTEKLARLRAEIAHMRSSIDTDDALLAQYASVSAAMSREREPVIAIVVVCVFVCDVRLTGMPLLAATLVVVARRSLPTTVARSVMRRIRFSSQCTESCTNRSGNSCR